MTSIIAFEFEKSVIISLYIFSTFSFLCSHKLRGLVLSCMNVFFMTPVVKFQIQGKSILCGILHLGNKVKIIAVLALQE